MADNCFNITVTQIPPPTSPQPPTEPRQTVILDYSRPPPASEPRPPAGNLTYGWQFFLGILSSPAWLISVVMTASTLRAWAGGTELFWSLTIGSFVAVILLAAFKLRWPGLIPGAILGALLTPLVGLGAVYLYCALAGSRF